MEELAPSEMKAESIKTTRIPLWSIRVRGGIPQ
jgi:hypothetical protein